MRDLPVPSLLAVAGLAVGLIPGVPTGHLDPRVLLLGVLPPLLSAAAQQIPLRALAKVWVAVAVLAVGLVVVTATAVALVTHAAEAGVGLAAAFTLGAVLSSTDPVAVTALSRRLRLPQRLETLVLSESLFNDATSLLLFQVAVASVVASGSDVGHVSWLFVRIAAGGVLVGLVIRAVATAVLRKNAGAASTLLVDVAAPYAAAVIAYALGVSVVTAVIVATLGIGIGRRAARTYTSAVLILENVMFVVVGFELATFLRDLPHSQRGRALVLAGLVTATLLAVRAFALGLGAVIATRRRRHAADASSYRPWHAAAVVTWAGTRGVVPLVAALSVPLTIDDGRAFPHRPLLLVVAVASTVVTLVVQGATLAPLVRRLGVRSDG